MAGRRSRWPRRLLPALGGLLTLAAATAASGEWVLWERPVDTRTQAYGEWHPRGRFEAERWCRAAMTSAINRALTLPRGKRPADAPRTVAEYRCLPDTADPAAESRGPGSR